MEFPVLGRFARKASLVVDAFSKRSMNSFCLLESGRGQNLIGNDGSIATMLKVVGISAIGSEQDLLKFCDSIAKSFTPFLLPTGHAVQFFLKRDPDRARDVMKSMVDPQRAVAKALQLSMGDIFDEKEAHLAQYIVEESAYIILWTRPSLLSGPDRKRMAEELSEEKPRWWPKAVDAMYLGTLAQKLVSRHDAFVNSIVASLMAESLETPVVTVPLSAHEALRAIRGEIYPGLNHAGFHPLLPEDYKRIADDKTGKLKMPWMRVPEQSVPDASHMLPPRISQQLFDAPATIDDGPGVVIRGRRYANIDMQIGPIEPRPFNALISNIRGLGEEPPWRVSFLVEGNGLSGYDVMTNSIMANMTAWAASAGGMNSALYKEAVEGLQQYQSKDHKAIPRIRVSFATWAPANDINLLQERVYRIQRAVENWGTPQTTIVCGDRLEGVMSSIPGLDIRSTAKAGMGPVDELLHIMPWMRESSPFETGSFLLRTRDGRPFPFEFGSSKQDSFVDLIYGGSGKGKSVLLNSMAMSFILSTAATRTGVANLPRFSTIDIGPSVQGPIELIRDSLPDYQKHLAIFHRLKNIREEGINPFDLPLGLEAPLPDQREMLINLVSTMATPANMSGSKMETPSGMIELAGAVIDLAYDIKGRGRNSSPAVYVPGEDLVVDATIESKLPKPPPPGTTWWEVRDLFFEAGLHREAKIAQRYAVPQLQDMMITNLPQIDSKYSDPDGVNLVKTFERMIQNAQKSYPILDGPTQIDLSSARIIGLDISGVAPKSDIKQTAIMYMLAMHLLTSDFMVSTDAVIQFPEAYRAFHENEITLLAQTPKRVVFDEFHRTAGVSTVRDQVELLAREGRKWGISLAIASQQLEDFGVRLVKLAANKFICGVALQTDVEIAKNVFGLSESATHALRRVVTGPQAGGAPVLCLFNMAGKSSKREHVLVNTLGPQEIWAYSTSQIDVSLRTKLYNRIGPQEARRRLGRVFPSGQASPEILRRAEAAIARGEIANDEANEGIIDKMADEISNAPIERLEAIVAS